MKKGLFDKVVQDVYVAFRFVPPAPTKLDDRLFYQHGDTDVPCLLPACQNQIQRDLEILAQIEGGVSRVEHVVLTGKGLDPSVKDPTSRLTCHVQISTVNLTDVTKEQLLKGADKLSDKMLGQSQHPLRFSLSVRNFDLSRVSYAYDPLTLQWLKTPRALGESAELRDLNSVEPKKTKGKYAIKYKQKKLHKI